MVSCRVIFLLLLSNFNVYVSSERMKNWSDDDMAPTVVIAFGARNKAHALPYFLSSLSAIEYPKNRISLWIKSDNNVDNTVEVLEKWLLDEENKYHSVEKDVDVNTYGFPDEKSQFDWSEMRFSHIINMKEKALDYAKGVWADYIWFLDVDIILTNKHVLLHLITSNKVVIAPMLSTLKSFSNFWCGMDENYYYRRTEDYFPIQSRKLLGVHNVTLVQAAVLVNLRNIRAQKLTFDPKKLSEFNSPDDDLVTFALSCKENDVPVYITNEEKYGYMTVPLDAFDDIEMEITQISDFLYDSFAYNMQVEMISSLKKFLPQTERGNVNFDQIYLINLKRRKERRKIMSNVFKQLGFNVKVFDAVDGKNLNRSFLADLKINELPQYLDPYHSRKMKFGEIGCFLSHYQIWEEIVRFKYKQVMIFEDDAKFRGSFRKKLNHALKEAEAVNVNWDLMYLGRKIMSKEESYWPGTSVLVNVSYSHWTVAYALTYEGAKKLIDEDPLPKLIPIDEYLPIMYNRHPRMEWSSHYHNRNLVALGIYPALVEPSHYLGEPGYITDTEDSVITNNEEDKKGDSYPRKDEL